VVNLSLVVLWVSWRINFVLVILLEHPAILVDHHFLPFQELLTLFKIRGITTHNWGSSLPLWNISHARVDSEFTTQFFVAEKVHVIMVRSGLSLTHILH
jgi:hypothetical protein